MVTTKNHLIQSKTQNFSIQICRGITSYRKEIRSTGFFNPSENFISEVTIIAIPTSLIYQLLNFKHQNHSHFM